MDINRALNEIIFKYHLDRYYPHYRNMYEAEKNLEDIIENIIQNKEKAIFVGDDKTEITFVRNMIKEYDDIYFCLYNRRDITFSQLEKVDWKKYDKIYLLSFYAVEHAERWFRLHNICYEWIYDVFEREGVFCEQEFFAFGKEHLFTLFDPKNEQGVSSPYTGAIQSELYCQQNKYNNAKDCKTKRIALERCLFLTIYMKHFIAAKEYAELLMKSDVQYQYMWEEIENLLSEIKRLLNERKQEDIILYWLDALPYGGECDMPYLQNVMEKCVKFENAFTYIGYTSPTLRTMFLGKKDIDDRVYNITSITKENSPVVRILEEQGYDIKIISSHFSVDFRPQYQLKQTALDWMVPASMKYWDMISGMLQQKQKALWLVHTLDAHVPCLSRRMNDSNYPDKKKRHRLAKQELDELLSFYDTMINQDTTRIYMSDHGNEAIYKYHILFNVFHRSLRPRKIDGLFSLLDFGTVLKQIIVDGDIREKEFVREYVEIGELDWRSYGKIEKIFRNRRGLSLQLFGHKGIIDKEYVYIHYTTGKEYLRKREDMLLCEPLLFYDCEDDVCDPELISKYRELAGEYPKDIIMDEKFKYSRYIHALYRNILQHNNMKRRIDMINQMLLEYPDSSVGIRMGGVASAMLYQILSKENRRKIWGIIDNNEKCLCSKLPLPILPADQIGILENAGVKAILLSSHIYLEIIKKEAETWPTDIDVLNIYDYLEKNGIECREEFYKVSGADEDYNVGFPFVNDKNEIAI